MPVPCRILSLLLLLLPAVSALLFGSVCHPLSATLNPASSLRVKPVRESDVLEQQCFEAFAAEPALAELSAAELRDELADYNEAVLKIARWPMQAAQLPLPANPQQQQQPTHPSTAPAEAAVSVPAATSAAAESARRLGEMRAEEAELQRALAAMLVGHHMTRAQHAQ